MSLSPRLMRSDSVYPDSVYPDSVYNKTYDFSSEEEDDYDGRSSCSEILAGEEAEARDLQNTFRQQKIQEDYYGYAQVMQITVDSIKSSLTVSGYGLIQIEKSLTNNELYIYMPITGTVYTVPIDPIRTFQNLLDYILYKTPEFVEFGKGKEFEFVLRNVDADITLAKFMCLPLDKLYLSQGSIKLVSVLV